MLLAIDASSANKPNRSGVEWYAYYLIQAMKGHALREGERVVLYSPTPLEGALAELPAGWESSVLSWPPGVGWMKIRVTLELLFRRPDVFLVPAQGLPFAGRCAAVVHDVGYARVPSAYAPSDRRRVASETRRTIRRAKTLFAVSEWTRREAIDLFRVPSERIAVAPNAANRSVYRPVDRAEVERALRELRVSRHFFLYVGRLDEKKNLATLVRAFEQFKSDRGVGDPFELLLVGSPGYRFAQLRAAAERSPVRSSVRFLGYLPEEQSAALMSAATAFAFPSWYEGFGVPPLEAMSCGAPVIASDIPSLREVCADAALYASPSAAEAWTNAMRRLVSDSGLRDRLKAAGFERAARYDWNDTASVVWKTLRE